MGQVWESLPRGSVCEQWPQLWSLRVPPVSQETPRGVTVAVSPPSEQGQQHKDSKLWTLATLVHLSLTLGTQLQVGKAQPSPEAHLVSAHHRADSGFKGSPAPRAWIPRTSKIYLQPQRWHCRIWDSHRYFFKNSVISSNHHFALDQTSLPSKYRKYVILEQTGL